MRRTELSVWCSSDAHPMLIRWLNFHLITVYLIPRTYLTCVCLNLNEKEKPKKFQKRKAKKTMCMHPTDRGRWVPPDFGLARSAPLRINLPRWWREALSEWNSFPRFVKKPNLSIWQWLFAVTTCSRPEIFCCLREDAALSKSIPVYPKINSVTNASRIEFNSKKKNRTQSCI